MLDTVKQQVEYVLKNCPETRNSDKKLIVKIYREFYGVQLIDEIQRVDVPSFETIRRCRQRLQEQGYYEASPSVKAAREEEKKVYLEIASTVQ